MRANVGIDWLQFAIDKPVQLSPTIDKTGSTLPFYKRHLEYYCGASYHYASNNASRGVMVMPARCLARHGLDSGGVGGFLGDMIASGARFSRLDMAVTIEDDTHAITVDTITELIRDGHATLPAHMIGHIKSISSETDSHGRETTYIGDMSKRAKRGIIRVYDKGLEQGLLRDIITRLEVETKRGVAHSSARRIAETGDIGAVINTRIMLDVGWWKDVVGGNVAPLTRDMTQDEPDYDATWHWLITKVAPALGRKIAEDGEDTGNLESFLAAVRSAAARHG